MKLRPGLSLGSTPTLAYAGAALMLLLAALTLSRVTLPAGPKSAD